MQPTRQQVVSAVGRHQAFSLLVTGFQSSAEEDPGSHQVSFDFENWDLQQYSKCYNGNQVIGAEHPFIRPSQFNEQKPKLER